MERKLLYYPTIIMPSHLLKSTLLYWDKISSIVPLGFNSSNIDLSSNLDFNTMEYVKNEGLFEYLRPYEILYNNPDLNDIIYKEISFIVSSEKNKLIDDSNFSTIIFKEKMIYELTSCLLEKKLIKVNDSDSYLFRDDIAKLYMSILAKYIAEFDSDYTVPFTEKIYFSDIAYYNNSNNNCTALNINLQNMLPIPREDSSINDILIFKQKRKDELIYFRILLDDLLSELSLMDNVNNIKLRLVQFKEEIEVQTKILSRTMKEQNIIMITSSIKAIIDTLCKDFTSPTNGAFPEKLAKSVLSSAFEINQQQIKYFKNKNELKTSPYSFLMHANKEIC